MYLRSGPATWLTVFIFIVIAAVAGPIGIVRLHNFHKFESTAVSASGQIVDFAGGGRHRTDEIQFTPDGADSPVSFQVDRHRDDNIGDTVSVKYDPNNPSHADVGGRNAGLDYALIFAAGFCLLCGIGFAIALKVKHASKMY